MVLDGVTECCVFLQVEAIVLSDIYLVGGHGGLHMTAG